MATLKPLKPELPADRVAFAEALRSARGRMPLRAVAEKSNTSQTSIGRYFRGEAVPPLRTARTIVEEVFQADWAGFEPLWTAARADLRRGDSPLASLTWELNRLKTELAESNKRIERLELHLPKPTDKEEQPMPTKRQYILIHKHPGGMIRHYPYPLDSFLHAIRAAGATLHAAEITSQTQGSRFAEGLRQMPVGSIRTHRSGHAFRVLRADYTADGHTILPGLRVITTDMWWGTVDANQFMAHGPLSPGGEAFEGWYSIRRESDGYRKEYNGERLALKAPRRRCST